MTKWITDNNGSKHFIYGGWEIILLPKFGWVKGQKGIPKWRQKFDIHCDDPDVEVTIENDGSISLFGEFDSQEVTVRGVGINIPLCIMAEIVKIQNR